MPLLLLLQVLILLERVSEAQRFAALQLREVALLTNILTEGS